MANPEHLKIFRRGVRSWNRWRQKHRGLRPDLSGADLKRANFRHANLNDANLEYANLEGANLDRAYLEGAEMQGASQRGAHLFGAELRHADLRGVDLQEAQLWCAHLVRADLRRANLIDADLRSCDLTAADLRGADLSGARLAAANLHRTDLRDARLAGATLHGTRFSECRLEGADLSLAEAALTAFNTLDLSRARGLGAVRHERPSSIGFDTLELTAAGIEGEASRKEVIAFLLAAGIPEGALEILTPADKPAPTPLYIVHSLADGEFARRLYGALQHRGIRCWLHEHPMLPGEVQDEGFDLGSRGARGLVLCCSDASLTSWWLAEELDAVAGRDLAALLPVTVGSARCGEIWDKTRAARGLPPAATDFDGWESDETVFERAVERLEAAIRAASGSAA